MQFAPQPVIPPDAVHTDSERPCLACGYNLRGLGDGPRCPECGLLNLPDGLRRQVWALVDSGAWFFSAMFHPFPKRLPGWWWALDRDGDVRKSFRAATRNLLIATVLVMTSTIVASGVVLEVTNHYASFDSNNVSGQPAYEEDSVVLVTADDFSDRMQRGIGRLDWGRLYQPGCTVHVSSSSRVLFVPSWSSVVLGAQLAVWVYLVWAGPGLVGLWTQVRKGLPKFALARRTVVAAANYESHRAIYLAILVAVGLGIKQAIRLRSGTSFLAGGYYFGYIGIILVVVGFAAVGWIGPVRSDFTKKLVRSKFHMLRIVVMYALILPLAFLFTTMVFVAALPYLL
jgi:hypothetical protein